MSARANHMMNAGNDLAANHKPRLTPRGGLGIQRKLEAGAPGDVHDSGRSGDHHEHDMPGDLHEREADAMADHVIHQNDLPPAELAPSSGQLPPATKSFMEDAFSADFSAVTIHTDQEAASLTRSIQAKAFTHGRDIYFSKDRFDTGSATGSHLLAHELAHVVQQGVPTARPEGSAPSLSHAPVGIHRSAEDWLQGSLDISGWGYTQLSNEADTLVQWLSNQTVGTEDTDRIREVVEMLHEQMAAKLQQPPDPQKAAKSSRSRKKSKAANAGPASKPNTTSAAPAPTSDDVMPRILQERTSVQYADPEDMRHEVDRIIDWLRRPNLSKLDTQILREELNLLAPQFEHDRVKKAVLRNSASINAALSSGGDDARSMLLNTFEKFDSIRPLSGKPGFSYLMDGNQMLTIPDSQVAAIRQQLVDHLDGAARQIRSMNEETKATWQNWYNDNYKDHPGVGFVVSTFHGSDPMDLLKEFMPKLSLSNYTLNKYWPRRATTPGPLYDQALAIADGGALADEARDMVDREIDAAVSTAGNIVTGLKITAALGAAAAAIVTAGVAAPAVAGLVGAEGLGLTGATAFAASSLGTGTVLGVEGAAYKGLPSFAGELAAGSDTSTALHAAEGEAWSGFKENFGTGVGLGATRFLGEALSLGSEGLSAASRFGRSALAGAGGNFTGTFAGSLIQGKGLGDSFDAALWSMPGGAAASTLGVAAQSFESPAAQKAFMAAGSTLLGAGETYLRGGSKLDIIQAGAQSFLTSMYTSDPTKDAAFEKWGAGLGRSAGSQARAYTAAIGLGINSAIPITRGIGASGLNPAVWEPSAYVSQPSAPIADPELRSTPENMPRPTDASGTVDPASTVTPAADTAAPAREISDEGYRPAPGERSRTRQDWYEGESARRDSLYLDRKLAGLEDTAEVPRITGSTSNAYIEGHKVPGRPPVRSDIQNIPLMPGETMTQGLERVNSLIGHDISEFPQLEAHWNDARAAVLRNKTLTSSNYEELYNKVRSAFYYRVWGDQAARELIGGFGFGRAGGRTSAPVLAGGNTDIPVTEFRLSLDHILEKAQGDNWRFALDANNLRFEFAMPNTHREIIQARHPELRNNSD